MSELHPDKVEIQKQWDADPCGAVTVQDQEAESAEFYRAIRRYRYDEYGPWFDRVVRFDDWHSKDVLEIGVGLGSDHYRFARAGNRMTALDLSREHLRHTQQHLHLEGLTTTAYFGDAEQMPFPDNTFDLVYSFGVLHHTPDTQQAVNEVLRVLRPGGTAIIGLYHRNSWFVFFSVILRSGLLHGGFWRKGWRHMLSEIEYRSDPNSARPLVKLTSKRSARKIFRRFDRVVVESCDVKASHFYRLESLMSSLGSERLETWLGFGGWYLMIHARKAESDQENSARTEESRRLLTQT